MKNSNEKYALLNPFSAETEFRRQILTSEVDPRTEGIKHVYFYNDRRPITYLSIQMNHVYDYFKLIQAL